MADIKLRRKCAELAGWTQIEEYANIDGEPWLGGTPPGTKGGSVVPAYDDDEEAALELLRLWNWADEDHSWSLSCGSARHPSSGAKRPREYRCTLFTGTMAEDNYYGCGDDVAAAIAQAWSRTDKPTCMGRTFDDGDAEDAIARYQD